MTVRIRGAVARVAADQNTAFWVLLWLSLFFYGVDLATDALLAFGVVRDKIGGSTAHEYAGHLLVTMIAILRAGGQSLIERLNHPPSDPAPSDPAEPKP